MPSTVIETYFTHDNGRRPYCVEINHNGRMVKVSEYKEHETYNIIHNFEFINIFVGWSPLIPMTEFSRGYGPDFDGNSILLETDENEYIFIGHKIIKFKSKSKIREFVSPVGNNDVPYPYAIDEENNYYLILEEVIYKKTESVEDPYNEYYSQKKMTGFQNIVQIKIGDSHYNYTYNPFPENNYDRLVNWNEGPIKKVMSNDTEEIFEKNEYVNINDHFGENNGFEPLVMEEI